MEIINRYGTLGYHGVCTSKLIDDVINILVILRLRVTSRGSQKSSRYFYILLVTLVASFILVWLQKCKQC